MVEGFFPALGRGDGDFKVLLDAVLSDELGEAAGTQAGIKRRVLDGRFAGYDASYLASPPEMSFVFIRVLVLFFIGYRVSPLKLFF